MPGYTYDSETGLYYLNARYYAPQLGRFINRDDFHGFEDEPASLNQYNYGHSNPVMFVDPDGHWVQTAGTIVRGVATAGRYVATGAAAVAGSEVIVPAVIGIAAGTALYYVPKKVLYIFPSVETKTKEIQGYLT